MRKKQDVKTVHMEEFLAPLWEPADPKDLKAKGKDKIFVFLKFLAATALAGALIPLSMAGGIASFATAVDTASASWEALNGDVSAFAEYKSPKPIVFTDRDGTPFATINNNSVPSVKYGDVSQAFWDALIATEDAKFFQHNGVDYPSIVRSAVSTAAGERQGASTITMQVVQNLRQNTYGDNKEALGAARGDNVLTKAQEIKLALNLEKKYSKKEILEMYVNNVYFGNKLTGIYEASAGYFSVAPSQLTVPQSALLVGMLKGPAYYDPIAHPEQSVQRTKTVLGRMLTVKKIDQQAYDTAVQVASQPQTSQQNIDAYISTRSSSCATSQHPYYCVLAEQYLRDSQLLGATQDKRAAVMKIGGFTVKTALEPTVTKFTEEATAKWDSGGPWEIASAVVQPGSGQILAVGQSTTWQESQIVYADSPMQVGSTFKPFVAAEAFRQGIKTSKTFYSGNGYVSKVFDNPASGSYKNTMPAGNINMNEATRVSNNVYFIRLAEEVGLENVANLARKLGLKIPALTGREGSVAIGSTSHTPIEMASAYATFASGGVYCKPIPVMSVTWENGKTVDSNPDCVQALDSDVAFKMNELLKNPFNGFLAKYMTPEGLPVRAKTGSTNDYAVGNLAAYSPTMSEFLWVTNPQAPSAPIENIKIYGRAEREGAGAAVGGKYMTMTLYPSIRELGETGERFPDDGAKSIPSPPQQNKQPVYVAGLAPENAVAKILTTSPTASVKIASQNDSVGLPPRALAWDGTTLTVAGKPDWNGATVRKTEDNKQQEWTWPRKQS